MEPKAVWPQLVTRLLIATMVAAGVLAAGCEPRRPSDPKPPSDPGRNLPKPITAVAPAAPLR